MTIPGDQNLCARAAYGQEGGKNSTAGAINQEIAAAGAEGAGGQFFRSPPKEIQVPAGGHLAYFGQIQRKKVFPPPAPDPLSKASPPVSGHVKRKHAPFRVCQKGIQ